MGGLLSTVVWATIIQENVAIVAYKFISQVKPPENGLVSRAVQRCPSETEKRFWFHNQTYFKMSNEHNMSQCSIPAAQRSAMWLVKTISMAWWGIPWSVRNLLTRAPTSWCARFRMNIQQQRAPETGNGVHARGRKQTIGVGFPCSMFSAKDQCVLCTNTYVNHRV